MMIIMKKPFILLTFLFLLVAIAACEIDDPQVDEISLVYRDVGAVVTDDTDVTHVLATGVPGEDVTPPADPVKEGHEFLGWFADEALTEPYVFSVFPDEETTLYASWNVMNYTLDIRFDLIIPMEELYMNDSMVMMVDEDGSLWCWGYGGSGGRIAVFGACPVETADGQKTIWPHDWANDIGDWGVQTMNAWNQQSFIVTEDSRVFAWGENTYGLLGTGDTDDRTRFVEITDAFMLAEDETLIDITGSTTNTYAISSHGRVFAWGRGIGLPFETEPDTVFDHPIEITDALRLDADERIVQISAAWKRAYALSDAGNLYAWGTNDNLELGTHRNAASPKLITRLIVSGEENIVEIGGSENGFFALKDNGEVCMLSNVFSASEDHGIHCVVTPNDGEDFALEMISGGGGSGGTVLVEGIGSGSPITLYFWGHDGDDLFGQDSMLAESFVEVNIVNTPPVASDRSLVITDDAVCALDDERSLWCWGRNGVALDEETDVIVYDERFGENDLEVTPKSNDRPSESLSLAFGKVGWQSVSVAYGSGFEDAEADDVSPLFEWFVQAIAGESGAYFDDYACSPWNMCPVVYGTPMPAEDVSIVITLLYTEEIKRLFEGE